MKLFILFSIKLVIQNAIKLIKTLFTFIFYFFPFKVIKYCDRYSFIVDKTNNIFFKELTDRQPRPRLGSDKRLIDSLFLEVSSLTHQRAVTYSFGNHCWDSFLCDIRWIYEIPSSFKGFKNANNFSEKNRDLLMVKDGPL